MSVGRVKIRDHGGSVSLDISLSRIAKKEGGEALIKQLAQLVAPYRYGGVVWNGVDYYPAAWDRQCARQRLKTSLKAMADRQAGLRHPIYGHMNKHYLRMKWGRGRPKPYVDPPQRPFHFVVGFEINGTTEYRLVSNTRAKAFLYPQQTSDGKPWQQPCRYRIEVCTKHPNKLQEKDEQGIWRTIQTGSTDELQVKLDDLHGVSA